MSDTKDQNKIVQSISDKELKTFIDRCYETSHLTLRRIQEMAGEYGIQVSLMGAKSFRDTTYERHLNRIRRANDLSSQIKADAQGGGGSSLADAAATAIASDVFDMLVNRDTDAPMDYDVLSKIVKRLKDSNRGDVALEHRIQQDRFDAVKAAIKHAKEIKTISEDRSLSDEEKTNRIQLRLFGERPADFKRITEE